MQSTSTTEVPSSAIAIIGMACHFPGAPSLEHFWQLLRDGREGLTTLTREALLAAGVTPALIDHPDYVPVRGVLEGVELFDAEFFGMSPREAELTDPQQRHMLECAWAAFEDAGYDPQSVVGSVGVFAGSGWNSYLLTQLAQQTDLLQSDAGHQVLLGNEKDNLTTRVSYKLGLTGPSLAVQTGCSSSLVAVSIACESLLNFQCDMALAGGVSITVPQAGYLFRQGGILSPDGRCRAFDAQAQGTVLGNGAGLVLLKRLDDAIADQDRVYAVIRGSAINNDGARKVGYTAPSVEGQAHCIAEALSAARVEAQTVSYVEAHGTGTEVGDPIEVRALQEAYRDGSGRPFRLSLGSVKTNIGHLDAAAGVAGLIKLALMLDQRTLVPSLHFTTPNPRIDLTEGEFAVSQGLAAWPRKGAPRRAGISSLGLGGTNVHAVLEEAPGRPAIPSGSGVQLLVLSARSAMALDATTLRLAQHLRRHPDLDLASVSYTLRVGRRAFQHRRCVVATDRETAIRDLEASVRKPGRLAASAAQLVMSFPGQGSQYVGMARDPSRFVAGFDAYLERCLAILRDRCGLDLRELLYSADATPERVWQLQQTSHAQPALFAMCHSLACCWMEVGAAAHALLGHSVGELLAATLAGVFTLEDGLVAVATRGRLMQEMPPGAMLAVRASSKEVSAWLPSDLEIAAHNETGACVVGGAEAAITAFAGLLASRDVACHRLPTSHAFHSSSMQEAGLRFAEALRTMKLGRPRLPVVSNVTGTWLTDEEAMSPDYWGRQLRQPVQFSRGLAAVFERGAHVVLEVGPGRTLTQMATRHPSRGKSVALASFPRGGEADGPDDAAIQNVMGALWSEGLTIDWKRTHPDRRGRVSLPTYPFERSRHWFEPPHPAAVSTDEAGARWASLARLADEQCRNALIAFDQPTHAARKGALDALCVAYVARALSRMNLFRTADLQQPVRGSALLERSETIPRFHQLFDYFLDLLCREGLLQRQGDGYVELSAPLDEHLSVLQAKARQAWASAEQVVELVHACGEALPEVLCGHQAPLELFTSVIAEGQAPEQSAASLQTWFNSVLQSTFGELLRQRPYAAGPLRVIEIGGGTGIASTALLPTFPVDRVRYTFTDIGGYFVARAREKFGSYPFVDASVLNVDESPQQQGFGRHSYDVVVAVNMLHATRCIDASLRHVRSLLAPEGILLIWEITKAAPDFGLTYGLLMEPVQDGDRGQGDPFLDATQWEAALRRNGFGQVLVLPESNKLEQQLVFAQVDDSGLAPQLTGFDAPSTVSDAAKAVAEHARSALIKKPELGDWFNEVSWHRRSAPVSDHSPRARVRRTLAFLDERLGPGLAERLRGNCEELIVVERGEEFVRDDPNRFVASPDCAEHMFQLLDALQNEQRLPLHVVHCWGLVPSDEKATMSPTAEGGFHGLLFLAQWVANHLATESLQLAVVTQDVYEVTGSELVSPDGALLAGFVRVAPLEVPNLGCRHIDIHLASANTEARALDLLAHELSAGGGADAVVALRAPHRWVQATSPIAVGAAQGLGGLREQGVYLITGGLGKIGLALAEHLADSVGARLVLVGRSELPDASQWAELAEQQPNTATGALALSLLRLTRRNTPLLLARADVGDAQAMESVVRDAESRFGPIHGVIHSAGLLGDGGLQRKTVEQINQVIWPKVRGARVLEEVFQHRPLDFLMLFSSLSAVRPGFGQLAYCAANSFLDAFCRKRAPHRRVCVSWDVWQGDGMAYAAEAPALIEAFKRSDFMARGLKPREGVEVFRRALACGLPHVLVCTSDYLSQQMDLTQLYAAGASESLVKGEAVERLGEKVSAAEDLSTVEALQMLWTQLLGVRDIGMDDDFFALGGDSLIGTLLVSRIHSRIGVKLSTRSVYDHRTIRALAAEVEAALVRQAGTDQLQEVLRSLQHLT